MAGSQNSPQQTFDEATAERLQATRGRFSAAWERAVAGGPRPEVDSFLMAHPDTERDIVRQTLEAVQKTYLARLAKPGTPATTSNPTTKSDTPHDSSAADPNATVALDPDLGKGAEPSVMVDTAGDTEGTVLLDPSEDGAAREASDRTIDYRTPEQADSPSGAPPRSADLGTVNFDSQSQLDFEVGGRDAGSRPVGGGGPAKSGPDRAVAGYEILGELGRGGMGVVYRARQIKLDRQVALKMVLAGAHAGPDQLQRFYTEAQAVAHLQHPNIVQIYEVGEQDGLPYFSLEFVDGGCLADKCDGKPQPECEAARMVETLARAMHHAHQHNVVHRDLKPANVLLTRDGSPKITDFGLAKRLEGESSSQTRSGAIMGTPSYMAPEQALGEVHQIGPLTDVYSLGALLYELLTGRPPFLAATPMDTVIQVTRDEPVPPSQLRFSVPRDLETICLKCLQKEQAKRYSSADTLADDLRRFLAGEPILARPVSAPERLWRWCRRNPRVAMLGATIAALLVVGFIGSMVAAITIAHERDQKETQREAAELAKTAALVAEKLAKDNEKKAEQQAVNAVGVFYEVVTKTDKKLSTQPGEGMQQLRLDVLADTREGLDRVLESVQDSPKFSRTAAALWQHMADVYRELGRTEEAREFYEKCRAVIEVMAAQDPDHDATIFNLSIAHERLGSVSLELEDLAVASEYYRKSHEQRIRLTKIPITDPLLPWEKVQESLANSYLRQSELAAILGDPFGAWEFLSRYLELKEGVRYASPREFFTALSEGTQKSQYPVSFQIKVGAISLHANDAETCRALYDRALKRSQAAYEKSPDNPAAKRAMVQSCGALGDLHLQFGQPDDAAKHYAQSHAITVGLAARDPDNANMKRELSFSHYRVATASLMQGNTADADKQFEICLDLRRQLAEADPRNAHKQIDLMVALARCGRHDEASQVAVDLGARASQDPSVLFQVACGYALCVPGIVRGRPLESLAAAEKALADNYRNAALEAIAGAVARGFKDAVTLERDPDLSPLRDEPAFQKLVNRLKQP